MNHPHENIDGLPIGPQVDAAQAPLPGRVTLQGAYVDLVPLDPLGHGESLFTATCGPAQDPLWLYLFDGPYADRQSFDRALRSKADSAGSVLFRHHRSRFGVSARLGCADAHRAGAPGHRSRQHPVFAGAATDRGATEAMYLLARYVFETLGYRRYEWKCNALNAPSVRAARGWVSPSRAFSGST